MHRTSLRRHGQLLKCKTSRSDDGEVHMKRVEVCFSAMCTKTYSYFWQMSLVFLRASMLADTFTEHNDFRPCTMSLVQIGSTTFVRAYEAFACVST
eukprot:144239-Amphidinium_carterae.2